MRTLIPASRRVLEPIERISEVLFGLIMVLTFTGSLSIAEAGRDDVRAMLIGALGCNLAWGVIDAVLYLMGAMAERGQKLALLQSVRLAGNTDTARQLVASALPPIVADLMEPHELDAIRQRLTGVPDSHLARLQRDDYLGGVAVFLIVFLSTFPVTIPFMVMSDAAAAMRASNTVAVVLLLITGWAFGRATGRPPWRVAIAMVVLGLGLVAMTMALGG